MRETTSQHARARGARVAAADEIWATCTSWAQRDVASAVLIHRGPDPLWCALEARMREGGTAVRRIELDAGDQSWDPLRAVGDCRADVLVHHDPFLAGGDDAANGLLADVQRELLTRFARLVVVSFPHGLRDEAVRAQLDERYLRALTFPHRALARRAHAVSALLGLARSLELVGGSEERPWAVVAPFASRSDWTAVPDGPAVLQLPLGEVWVDVEDEHRSTGSGEVSVTTRDGFAMMMEDGAVRAPSLGQIPVCEIGVGVNPATAPLHATVLSEKADGTLHLGVGENLSLGGRTSGPDHRDLMLDEHARLTVRLRERGRSVVLGAGAPSTAVLVSDANREPRVLRAKDLPRAQEGVVDGAAVTVTRVPATPVPEHRDNVRALESLADPRLSEVVLLPHGDAPLLGNLGARPSGLGKEPKIRALLDLLTELLGPLPWRSITVVAAPSEHADATSRPGIITVAPRLVGRPLELRWLYLAHELVHQWVGGAVRLGPRHAQAWEDVVERLAHACSVQVLGPTSLRPFQRLRARQARWGPDTPDWISWTRDELRDGVAPIRRAVSESLCASRRTEDLDPAALQLPAPPHAVAGIA